ncbi:MAG: hypothetical protein LBI03_05740 [Clostridiales bacterium]|jgi:hypothetical protein|nr:hypothetical protein [Clostridiales bacterium]
MNIKNELIEMQIMNAVRKLLTENANELLGSIEYAIPLVEFGNYGGNDVVFPSLSISTCELTEKERIIRLSAFTLTISFNVPDNPDSELHSYTYAWAVCRAFEGNATLEGIADRAVVTAKKFNAPKNPNCGQSWEVVLTVRITNEQ